MQAQRPLILGLTLSLGWLGACGDDDKPKDKPEPDSGIMSPKPDGGNKGPKVVTCGGVECRAPEAGSAAGLGGLLSQYGGSPEPCCMGEAQDICGVSSELLTGGECVEQKQEGKPNSACEGFSPLGPLLSIPGCCKPSNQCGLDLDAIDLGVGCMERSEVSDIVSNLPIEALLGGLGGLGGGGAGDAGIALPTLEAVPCDFNAVPETDAGSDPTDAGSDPTDAGTDPGDAGTDAG